MSDQLKKENLPANLMDGFNDLLMLRDYSKVELESRLQKNEDEISVLKIKSLLNLPFSNEFKIIENQVSFRVLEPVVIMSELEYKESGICLSVSIPLSYGIYLIPASQLTQNHKPLEVFTTDSAVLKSKKILELIGSYIQENISDLEEENLEIKSKIFKAA